MMRFRQLGFGESIDPFLSATLFSLLAQHVLTCNETAPANPAPNERQVSVIYTGSEQAPAEDQVCQQLLL